jgi:lipopolysaccharide export LptBFGC system permease protein LptF
MAKLDPHAPAPARGANELRAAELRELVRDRRTSGRESEARWLELTYYRRWSMSVTPLAMVALMVALAFRRQWSRQELTSVAFGISIAHYALVISAFSLAELGVARPIVVGWAAPFLCLAAALLLTSWRPRARA